MLSPYETSQNAGIGTKGFMTIFCGIYCDNNKSEDKKVSIASFKLSFGNCRV